MAVAEQLKSELETYEREKESLIAKGGEGKFALIHGDAVAGVWCSYEDALRAGYETFGLDPFLVKQIQSIERVQFITRDVSPCRA
jgi:hypothetical protein